MKRSLIVFLFVILVTSTAALADADDDGIRQAILDYANSFYDVKPELVDKSVHPKLQKIGWATGMGADGYRELWMNFYELKELAARANAEGRFDSATARREIKILDKLPRIAVARLDAEWGIDYFHLAKIDGRWMIMNVVWQTYPAKD